MGLSHVTFTGWDRHTDLVELQAFLEDIPQERVEIAVLFSNTRSINDDDRYPDPAKAVEILRTAKGAGQRTAVHICGSAAIDMLTSAGRLSAGSETRAVVLPRTSGSILQLADRVQLNVDDGAWGEGQEKYAHAYDIALALGRPVIVQTRDIGSWPNVRHFAPRAERMVSFLFDRSAGAGVEMIGYPDPPPGRLVGYAGGIGPDNAAALVAKLAAHPGARFWIDMESRIREPFKFRAGDPAPSFVSISKCSRVMAAVASWLERT